MNNPPCPHCQHQRTVKIGVNKSGTQRYKCKSCGKRFVQNPVVRTPSPNALTNAERQRRHYYRAKELPEINISKLSGKLITFEGVEGSGKSTQLALLHDYLLARGCDVVTTKEPSAIAKSLLMESDGLDATGQLLFLMADRQNHVVSVVRPALARGAIVLCDRYIDSTYAYQCSAGGASAELLETLRQQLSIPLPDITIWLDMPYQRGLRRAKQRGTLDRIERMPEAYHALVQNGFECVAKDSRVLKIGASGTPPRIHRQVLQGIDGHLAARTDRSAAE